MNDLISDDVWSFFCTKLPQNERDLMEQKRAYSEMEWFVQIEEMRSKLIRATVRNLEECDGVFVRIPLMAQIFELTIQKSEEFPDEPPVLSGEFMEGFDDFEWSSERSLYELADRFTDYCQALDAVILEVREADTFGFLVEKLEIDENESGHLFVRMEAVKYKEIVTMSIDIGNFHSFPRILRCSNPSRTNQFDCEKWISDDKLGKNLLRFYGELGEEKQHVEEQLEAVEKNSFGDNVELMDFI